MVLARSGVQPRSSLTHWAGSISLQRQSAASVVTCDASLAGTVLDSLVENLYRFVRKLDQFMCTIVEVHLKVVLDARARPENDYGGAEPFEPRRVLVLVPPQRKHAPAHQRRDRGWAAARGIGSGLLLRGRRRGGGSRGTSGLFAACTPASCAARCAGLGMLGKARL